MPSPQTPVSLADVARLASVSPSTASKALNAKTDVKASTRARVEQAARELGYLPNTQAQSLAGARTRTVGAITMDLDGRFAMPILNGVEDVLGVDKVLCVLCNARGDSAREAELIETLLARRVDGIILVGNQTDPRESVGDIGVPVVYAMAQSADDSDLSVIVDNHHDGLIAGRHLVGLGRTRIAHVGGEAHHGAARDRYLGLLGALESNGLSLAGTPLFGDWTEGWGRAAAQKILDGPDEVDAIACASDSIARGVLDKLHERGIDVPGTIAVIGCDNWEPLAANSRPALTTVDIELEQLGRVAARLMQRAGTGHSLRDLSTACPVCS